MYNNENTNKEVQNNGLTKKTEMYYRNYLQEVLNDLSKDRLEDLLTDLDMDDSVGGRWLYVNPADTFFFKTKKELDCISVPFISSDGSTGCMDVWDFDLSYAAEGTVMIDVDNLFTLEFDFDLEHPYKNTWCDVRVVRTCSNIDEPCCYDGGKIVLDNRMIALVETLMRDNISEK